MLSPSRLEWAAAGVVATLVGLLVVVPAAANDLLWNDAMEYVAIANAWVHGAGFVDPIKWTYYLETTAPFPAFALRAPLPVLLLAVPLALGASIPAVRVFHASMGGLIVGAVVLLACRSMSLPAAVACGLLVGLAQGFMPVATMPMSDLLAIGALLLVLATAPGATRSTRGALACAAATLAGWATRPTVLFMVAPILLGALWTSGLRGLARNRPIRVYLLATLGGYALAHAVTVALTGFAPYAGYGFMAEMVSPFEPLNYRKKYVGAATFVWTHLPGVLRNVRLHAGHLYESLFVFWEWSLVGWIALPGTLYWLRPGAAGERAESLRVIALTTWMFAAQAILTYGAYDGYRYPLPVFVCGALCGFAWLDDVLRGAGERLARRFRRARPGPLGSRAAAALACLLVLCVVTQFVLFGGRYQVGLAILQWRAYLGGPAAHAAGSSIPRGAIPALCPALRRGALVATRDPWSVHGWCGNPTIVLPADLGRRPRLQRAFLQKEKPSYVIADHSGATAWAATSRQLARVAVKGRLVVYEVRQRGPRPVAWRAPPPPLCAGRGASCPRSDLGRR